MRTVGTAIVTLAMLRISRLSGGDTWPSTLALPTGSYAFGPRKTPMDAWQSTDNSIKQRRLLRTMHVKSSVYHVGARKVAILCRELSSAIMTLKTVQPWNDTPSS